ncbi:MAG TPA: NAD-glutamate dehydrogenase, partial [Micrococcaceae bacterium]
MSSGSNTVDSQLAPSAMNSFIADYYEHLAEEDSQSYHPQTLENRAQVHRNLAQDRCPGTAKVEIVNEAEQGVVYIVTDDMPFLVDSVTAELVRQNAAIRMVMHPMFVVTRHRESHELVSVSRVPSYVGIASGDTAAMPSVSHLIAHGDNASYMESWIAVEIDRTSEAARETLIQGLTKILADVRSAVEDWQAMRDKAISRAEGLARVTEGESIVDLREAEDLLHWMDAGNFTFLGYREYDLVQENGEDVLANREGSGLGLLRDGKDSRQIQHLTATGQQKAREKRALVITKANTRSTVHRAAYLDYIGVKSFDAAGNVNGEQR